VYRISTTPDFDRDITALDPPVAARIIMKIEWLAGQVRDLEISIIPF
jgi:hypothetical protein